MSDGNWRPILALLKQLIQLPNCEALPGDLVPNDNKSHGRVLSKGTVAGNYE